MTHEHEKLVEIVARKLAFCDGFTASEPLREYHLLRARVAISAIYKAMKEPTPEMLESGRKAWKKPRLHVSHTMSDEFMTCGVIFAAMLAASALNGGRDE